MEFQEMSVANEQGIEGMNETEKEAVAENENIGATSLELEESKETKIGKTGKKKKEKDKKPKKKKEKKIRTKKAKGKKHSSKDVKTKMKTIKYRVSLRRQVLGGFLVPIVLIIFLGVNVYSTAEEGLIENYKNGATQSLGVTSQLLDSKVEHIEQLVFSLYVRNDVFSYCRGRYEENTYDNVAAVDAIKQELIIKNADPLISNIYLIPASGVKTLSTAGLFQDKAANLNVYTDVSDDFVFDDYYVNNTYKWIGNHPAIDAYWEQTNEDYIMSCFVSTKNDTGMLIVDVSYKEIAEILEAIQIPEGASISYITYDGREVNLGSENIQGIATEQFYLDAVTSEELSGNEMVEVNGESYLFMYQKCNSAGAVIAELVPESVIMEKAYAIRNIAMIISIITIIIVVGIGFMIAIGLQRKLGRLQKSLKQIAKGDFTAKVEGEGNTAFGQVNKDMSETISGVKHLVQKVKDVATEVSTRVDHVEEATEDISKSAIDINSAIEEIEAGTTQQANDATDCLSNMDDLSNRILSTSTSVEEVTGIADQTIDRIESGYEQMEELIAQSVETGRLSEDVGAKVLALAESSKQIESFVSQIEDIADETNLLALNASIEAARAGDAGRGFAVVASEIQKLSENSMEASHKIADVVKVILSMTEEARVSTEKAVASIETQQVSVAETGQNFEEMNKAVRTLIEKLNDVTEEIALMQKGRQATLNGIENISSVSEETAAVSESVGLHATSQTELTNKLKEISTELKESTDTLLQEISLFKVE